MIKRRSHRRYIVAVSAGFAILFGWLTGESFHWHPKFGSVDVYFSSGVQIWWPRAIPAVYSPETSWRLSDAAVLHQDPFPTDRRITGPVEPSQPAVLPQELGFLEGNRRYEAWKQTLAPMVSKDFILVGYYTFPQIESTPDRDVVRSMVRGISIKDSFFEALFLLGCVAVLGPLLVVMRQDRRERAGLCPVCGYDIRACTDRCSECGTTLARDGVVDTQ